MASERRAMSAKKAARKNTREREALDAAITIAALDADLAAAYDAYAVAQVFDTAAEALRDAYAQRDKSERGDD
jgi:hypothetical protein